MFTKPIHTSINLWPSIHVKDTSVIESQYIDSPLENVGSNILYLYNLFCINKVLCRSLSAFTESSVKSWPTVLFDKQLTLSYHQFPSRIQYNTWLPTSQWPANDEVKMAHQPAPLEHDGVGSFSREHGKPSKKNKMNVAQDLKFSFLLSWTKPYIIWTANPCLKRQCM